jgi:hypothetical protein
LNVSFSSGFLAGPRAAPGPARRRRPLAGKPLGLLGLLLLGGLGGATFSAPACSGFPCAAAPALLLPALLAVAALDRGLASHGGAAPLYRLPLVELLEVGPVSLLSRRISSSQLATRLSNSVDVVEDHRLERLRQRGEPNSRVPCG